MMQFGLIGLGSGAAAALLFASLSSGTPLSVPLAYLAPLPLMIAALGWSHWAALIGAVIGGLAIWLVFGSLFFVAFFAGIGLPGWWLGYLAMLARPVDQNGTTTLEWYPPGRLVVWAAGLGIALIVLSVLVMGGNATAFREVMGAALRDVFRIATTEAGSSAPAALRDPERVIDVLVMIIPPATAVMATLTNALNLWLAGRIVKFSGRLTRPWPNIPGMTFPPLTAAALALAIALTFIDGTVGILAGIASAALLMAYGLLGFAVIHVVTQTLTARAFVLAGIYASVLIFGWPILILCLVGLADQIFNFRARATLRRGPPAST